MGPALPTTHRQCPPPRTSAELRGGAKREVVGGGHASLTEPKDRSTAGIPRGQDQRQESHQQPAVSEVSLVPSPPSSFILSAEQRTLLPSPVAHQDGPQQPLIPETTPPNGLSVHPRTNSWERRS